MIKTIIVPKHLNQETIFEFESKWNELDLAKIKILCLKGESDFCLGLDIQWISSTNEFKIDALKRFPELLDKIKKAPCVTVAAVNGMAVGGGLGLIGVCDIVLASKSSLFKLSEGMFGLIPGVILPFLSLRLTPQSIKKMVFTAKDYGVEEAALMGLVDGYCESQDFEELLEKWIKQLKSCQKQSIIDMKYLLDLDAKDRNILVSKGLGLLADRLRNETIKARLSNLAYFASH